MSSVQIPTQEVLHTVTTTTGFTVNVADCNLDSDLTVKDFIVINTSDNDASVPTSLWTKSSRTVLTYTGPALTAGHVLQIGRSTELERVQETIQLGSTVSSSILDAEILRLYKLIAEKLAGFVVSNPVNNVTRSTSTPFAAPTALGDEWHQFTPGGSSTDPETIRVWVATDTTGDIDELGWFEVTGTDGVNGVNGIAATVNVGTVTTGAAGSNAAVTNVGTSNAAVLNFSIPRGNTGANGSAATIAVGTVTTGAAGSNVSITNVGTSNAAVFNFSIPRGDAGVKGDTGDQGIPGALAPLAENTQVGTAYVLALSDASVGVTMDNGSANTVTIPTNAAVAFAIGTRIRIHQIGAGLTTVTGDTGVTVNGSSGGSVPLSGQWSEAVLWKRGVNTWSVIV